MAGADLDNPTQPAAGNADTAVVKLTPPSDGDWFVDEQEDDFTISTTIGHIICRVLTADDFPWREEGTDDHINDEALSNARLIAASKEILAAARRLAPVADYITIDALDDEKVNLVTSIGALRQLQSALSKAEPSR